MKNLTLAWMTRVLTGPRGGVPPTIIGGVGTREFTGGTIKGAVLQVGGILYVTAPDNVWALDALDGREIWHYFWKTRGATHIGNRGAAIWRNYLFFETPDNYLVSLDAKTGEERWHVEIADFDRAVFLDAGARSSSTTTSSSARATTSTAPDSFRPSIRKPESFSGSSTRCR